MPALPTSCNATEEDIEACRKALHKMEKSVESEPVDYASAVEGDEEFHVALCQAAHNRLLENIARPIINHAGLRNWKQIRRSKETIRLGVEGHRLILQGIEQKDVEVVLYAVEKHLKGVFNSLYRAE